LVKISTKTAKKKREKKKKTKKENNRDLLCRYWSLMYPSSYASDLVGKKCDG